MDSSNIMLIHIQSNYLKLALRRETGWEDEERVQLFLKIIWPNWIKGKAKLANQHEATYRLFI